jgi:hypothetical protein
MRKFATAAAASAALAAILGCGGSSSTLAPGQSPTCTVTLSGGLAGTYDCKPALAAWASANNTGGFTFTVGTSQSSPYITVAIGFPGEPHTGSYLNTGSGATGGVSVTSSAGVATQVWAATTGNTPTGSYSLTFTSVSSAVTTSSGKAYTTNGSLAATLSPLTAQSGSITLSATF